MNADRIFEYFPGLDPDQQQRMRELGPLYESWNARLNLISRSDMEHFWERHVLHSLAVAKFIRFTPGTRVMDLGTGGGFPGIPLSILFPQVKFTLVDSIAKKIRAVEAIAEALELKNTEILCRRAEEVPGSFDYVVSRAVAPLRELYGWTSRKILKKQQNAIPNGILCLKGGDLTEELKPFIGSCETESLTHWFSEPFFETKKLIFLPI